MKNVLKKGFVLLGLYLAFTAFLFLASERMENLENNEQIETAVLSSNNQ